MLSTFKRALLLLTPLSVLAAAPQVGHAEVADTREAVVYKSPSCGCCAGWISYLQRHGIKVIPHNVEDMDEVKDRMAVPVSLRSCHTATIGGYVVEGHVPMASIDRMLTERPAITGVAAPGMPSGSPGMNGPKEPNPIYSFGNQGSRLFEKQ